MRHLHHIPYHNPKSRFIHSRGSQAKGVLGGGVCEGWWEGLRRLKEGCGGGKIGGGVGGGQGAGFRGGRRKEVGGEST